MKSKTIDKFDKLDSDNFIECPVCNGSGRSDKNASQYCDRCIGFGYLIKNGNI